MVKTAKLNEITRREFLRYLSMVGTGATMGIIKPQDVFGKYINGVYVDDETRWTPENFRKEVVESPKPSLVYWRWDGKGDNKAGDATMARVVQDLNGIVAKFYQIDLETYDKSIGYSIVKEIINKNPTIKFGVPTFSLLMNGRELRIENAFLPHEFEEKYVLDTLPYAKKWISIYGNKKVSFK